MRYVLQRSIRGSTNGKNKAIVYSGKYFAVFDVDEYTEILAFLKD
jgi:hypothetical protein